MTVQITWAVAAIALGLVLSVIGALRRDAPTRKLLLMWGLPIIGVAFVVMVAGTALPEQIQFLNEPIFGKSVTLGDTEIQFAAAGGRGQQVTQTIVSGCEVEDVTVDLSATDRYTTAPTGGTHRYRKDGGPAKTVADAGTFTAAPGTILDILWGNETDSNYFGAVTREEVPCSDPVTFTVQLVRNGTLTIEVFNEENNLITATENETLLAGDTVTLTANLKGPYQKGFPYGGIIVAEYNKTTIDNVIVDFVEGDPVKVNVPSIYSISYATDSASKAYEVPPILSNDIIRGSIYIDVDDTTAPLGDGSDILLTFYPYDYFVNEDTGGSFDGPAVEDEDDTQTFGHATNFTIHVD